MRELPRSNWLLFFATIIGLIFAAEWATRWLAQETLVQAVAQYDPVIGTRGVPFGRTIVTRSDGRRHEIKLNSAGFRMSQEISKSIDRERVLFYGGTALFAEHLPLEMTVFSLLKNSLESANRRLQILNAAVQGHNIQQTRLLMREQIPEFRPTALIYIFDANKFSNALISGDPSAVASLKYDTRGRPKLSDFPNSYRSQYLEAIYSAIDWIYRHSHLINLLTRYAKQVIERGQRSLARDLIEVNLSELPRFAQESPDIQELMYLSELHFQNMVKMTKAASLPLLVLWLPAPLEAKTNSQNSALAKILYSHRNMLRRLAAIHEKFEFWDPFVNGGEKSLPKQIFISDQLKNKKLSVTGSRWFAKITAPAIQYFLQHTLEDRN